CGLLRRGNRRRRSQYGRYSLRHDLDRVSGFGSDNELARQVDLENGSAVIVHIDFAKLGANQLLDQRQTESARAVLGALRGKARLEDARQLGLRDARTRVADFEEQLRGIFANVDD